MYDLLSVSVCFWYGYPSRRNRCDATPEDIIMHKLEITHVPVMCCAVLFCSKAQSTKFLIQILEAKARGVEKDKLWRTLSQRAVVYLKIINTWKLRPKLFVLSAKWKSSTWARFHLSSFLSVCCFFSVNISFYYYVIRDSFPFRSHVYLVWNFRGSTSESYVLEWCLGYVEIVISRGK